MQSPSNKIVNGHSFISYQHEIYSESEMISRSKEFYEWMNKRRTVRGFSSRRIDKQIIDNILLTASTAPSGAHKQPWTFCVVTNLKLKKQIRIAAETEEKESYENRMSEEWLQDIAPLQTDWQKPFLEIAQALIVVFKKAYNILPNGTKTNNYNVNESVGLACGFMLAAIHHAGLVALTHTPSPMNFLTKILNRPENERPFLLIPIGYPSPDTLVPALTRKSLRDISEFL